MRLAIVTSFPRNPDRPVGGVEAVSVILARALAARDDLRVDVLTSDPDCAQPEQSEWDHCRIHRLPHSGKRILSDALGPGRRSICEYLRSLHPDVIHAHDVYGLMVKALDIPRVFTIHGFIHADTAVSGSRFAWLRSRLWHHFETGGWADQPHIISISPYVREYLRGIATGIIHDIDNPIDTRFFEIPREVAAGTIFCAALLCKRKNQIALVKALGRLRDQGVDANLRLAGAAADETYAGALRRCVSDCGLDERVTLLGSLDAGQIRNELSHAAVFSLVSLEEGSPMGIEEAMAAGIPVVTSNRCGMPYMVRHGESGYLVNPEDPEDIAHRLAQLLASGELRSKMGRAGRRIAEDRFHPARVAQRTAEVYREIAKSSVNTPA